MLYVGKHSTSQTNPNQGLDSSIRLTTVEIDLVAALEPAVDSQIGSGWVAHADSDSSGSRIPLLGDRWLAFRLEMGRTSTPANFGGLGVHPVQSMWPSD